MRNDKNKKTNKHAPSVSMKQCILYISSLHIIHDVSARCMRYVLTTHHRPRVIVAREG